MVRNIFLITVFSLSSVSIAIEHQGKAVIVAQSSTQSKAQLITKTAIQGLGAAFCFIIFLNAIRNSLFNKQTIDRALSGWITRVVGSEKIANGNPMTLAQIDAVITNNATGKSFAALAIPAIGVYFFSKYAYQNGKKLKELRKREKNEKIELEKAILS